MFITNNNYIVGITVFFNKTEGNTAADYAADYPQTMPQTMPQTTRRLRLCRRLCRRLRRGAAQAQGQQKALKTRLLQLLRPLDLDSFLFVEMLLDILPAMILWERTCRVVVQVTQTRQSVSSSRPEQPTSYRLSGHFSFASQSNITICKL